jgi:hypothetical protein
MNLLVGFALGIAAGLSIATLMALMTRPPKPVQETRKFRREVQYLKSVLSDPDIPGSRKAARLRRLWEMYPIGYIDEVDSWCAVMSFEGLDPSSAADKVSNLATGGDK